MSESREGTVYRRCVGCRRTPKPGVRKCSPVSGKPGCGDSRFSWAFKVDVAPEGAMKRDQRSGSGFADKGAAMAAMRELQDSVRRGARPTRNDDTLGAYLVEWLNGRGRFNPKGQPLAPSSYEARCVVIRCYVLGLNAHGESARTPHPIANVKLRSLSEDHLADFYEHLRTNGRIVGEGGLTDQSVFNVHRILRRALADAVKGKRLMFNPCDDVPGMGRPPQKKGAHWSALELHRFYEFVATDRLYAFWRLAGSTGMRRGELLGCRWPDIDFKTGVLTLDSQLAKANGKLERRQLKNRRGRTVALDVETLAALKALQKRQRDEQGVWPGPWGNDEHLCFTTQDGKAIHPDTVTKRFALLADRAGLPPLTLHGLRHSHISHALEAGESLFAVSRRAGHSTIAITADVYGHPAEQMDANLASKVAAFVAAQGIAYRDATAEERP